MAKFGGDLPVLGHRPVGNCMPVGARPVNNINWFHPEHCYLLNNKLIVMHYLGELESFDVVLGRNSSSSGKPIAKHTLSINDRERGYLPVATRQR